MTRYFRRVGAREWREITRQDYYQGVSVSPELFVNAGRVQFAQWDEQVQVAQVRADSSGWVEVYVDGARTYQTTFTVGNTRSYGCALHRAHEWCEQRGYVVDDVRLDE